MSSFEELAVLRQTTTTQVELLCGGTVSIQLEGYRATDYYATNLKLTGHTNWFGSMNICNLMAETGDNLFAERTLHATASSSSLEGTLRVLELGSGLGRAGIMAAKLLALRGRDHLVILTDGEDAVVDQLRANCRSNAVSVKADACRRLWWGDRSDLDSFMKVHPVGFDLILGCDLIYGPLAGDALEKLLLTVDTLLKPLVISPSLPLMDCNKSAAVPVVLSAVADEPCFLLAFTRRGAVTVEELLAAGLRRGLQGLLLEDFTFDIFENQVDGDSLFWTNTIVQFTRICGSVEMVE